MQRLKGKVPLLCFGSIRHSAMQMDGVVYFRRDLLPKEAAARLAHLLQHYIDPIRLNGNGSCNQQVLEVLKQEAQALSLELQLRRYFKLHKPIKFYAFERSYWQHTRAQRTVFIWQKLLPAKNNRLPRLYSQYMQRCERRKQQDK